MPVYLHTGTPINDFTTETPPDVPLDAAAVTVVVVLVGDRFVSEDGWIEWGRELRVRAEADDSVTFVGVALTEVAARHDVLFGRLNRERTQDEADSTGAYRVEDRVERDRHVRISVLRALARRLGGDERVRVFVSHAKQDGAQFATQLTYHLLSYRTDAWFDAHKIESGRNFEEELRRGLDNSCFVAIVTDVYATRDWCRWEAQLAKEQGLPSVVLDLVSEGQRRSLPSLGNMPVVRLNLPVDAVDAAISPTAKVAYGRVTEALLTELVSARYFPIVVEALRRHYGTMERWHPFPAPPELMSLAVSAGQLAAVDTGVYPDPPLPQFELKFLPRLCQRTGAGDAAVSAAGGDRDRFGRQRLGRLAPAEGCDLYLRRGGRGPTATGHGRLASEGGVLPDLPARPCRRSYAYLRR